MTQRIEHTVRIIWHSALELPARTFVEARSTTSPAVAPSRVLPICPSSAHNFEVKLLLSSLATGHLWCLFPDLPRVNDEFERVRILVLLHQLQVYESFGVSHGSAVLEPTSGRFE